jgi:tetratricopeptide (TPR) repeat protein
MKKGLLVLAMIFLAFNSYGQLGSDVYEIGVQKYDKGDFKGAIKNFTIAIEKEDSVNKTALKNYFKFRGMAKVQLEDNKGAIEDFTKAIFVDPNEVDLLYALRGFSKNSIKDYFSAILDFSEAINLNPNEGLYYAGRGIARIGNNKKGEGCLDFSKAGELGYELAYESIKEFCN